MGKSDMPNKSIVERLGGQKVIVLLVVMVLFAFFCIASPNFRQYSTVLSILDYSYYIALMAIGVTFPLITGGVDLSIGTGLICYSLVGGYLVVHKGCPTIVGILVAVAFGVAIGLLNGALVALMNLPPFMATLCTCMITRGLGALIVNRLGISWPTSGTEGSWFRDIFKTTIGDIKVPLGFLWVVLLVALMAFVLNHTPIGRYAIAIGSNKEAVALSGINVRFYHTMAYVISLRVWRLWPTPRCSPPCSPVPARALSWRLSAARLSAACPPPAAPGPLRAPCWVCSSSAC